MTSSDPRKPAPQIEVTPGSAGTFFGSVASSPPPSVPEKQKKRAKGLLQDARLRLKYIKEIIEAVDDRCMWVDGPVTPTLEEMTQAEISVIYSLAKGEPVEVRETMWQTRSNG